MNDMNILDIRAIAEAKAMMKTKFPTMVEFFLEDAQMYIGNIRDAIATENALLIVSPAHTLKSSSKQMGAVLVSEIAKQIEANAREQSANDDNDMASFVKLLLELEEAFTETKEAFKQQAA